MLELTTCSQNYLFVCLSPTQLGPNVLVDQVAVTESLKGAGFDVSRLQQVPPYGATVVTGYERGPWVETGMRANVADLNVFQVEVGSVSSSPGVQKV
jgi:hypothetical protein